ncbi:MAG: metalloregulator ArsR/SmtB family transcription factor, partial [Ruminococcus bromii]|nr:metalloregulator ArsR/SmtB family transcription factor [Ruminococcus bromii]
MAITASFRALADENRMLILRLLLRRNCCVRALSRQLDISEAAVSQHLKVLREAGLILGEKCGYFTHYTVNRATLAELADALY